MMLALQAGRKIEVVAIVLLGRSSRASMMARTMSAFSWSLPARGALDCYFLPPQSIVIFLLLRGCQKLLPMFILSRSVFQVSAGGVLSECQMTSI